MCKNRVDKENYWVICWREYHFIIIIIIGTLIFSCLFFWNLFAANNSAPAAANHFTALSGWVSFLGTFGVGIIAMIQTHIYAKETKVTNEKTTQLAENIAATNKATAQLATSINELVWKLKQPVLEINMEEPLVQHFQSYPLDIRDFSRLTNKKSPNEILFNISNVSKKELLNTPNFFCEIIQLSVVNTSDRSINNIDITNFAKIEDNGGRYISYSDIIGDIQGYIAAHTKARLTFNVFSNECFPIHCYDIPLFFKFTLQLTDTDGERNTRSYQIYGQNMKSEEGKRRGTPSLNLNPTIK